MNNPPYIVVVDDDRQLTKLFKHTLEDAGYEVLAMTSGKQVLAAIEKRSPDLLILDLNMPEPDGFDLLKLVRSTHPYLRMIVASGYLNGAMLEAARFVGAIATLQKPVKPEELVDKVRQVLGDDPAPIGHAASKKPAAAVKKKR